MTFVPDRRSAGYKGHSCVDILLRHKTATVHDPLSTNTALLVEDLPREKPVRSNVPSCDTALYPELAVGDTEASLTSSECPPEGPPNHV